ncbi:hypothetical protein EJA72_21245 [Pseudomonas sp. PB120]|nr:hypothetical protein [Pseudomonas sp. PB120]
MLLSPFLLPELTPVGASLLAMDVNDNAGQQTTRVVNASIASRLAPTGEGDAHGMVRPLRIFVYDPACLSFPVLCA